MTKQVFEPVRDPANWRVDRPFFRVLEGEGGLGAFTTRFEDGFRRKIDRRTGAKPDEDAFDSHLTGAAVLRCTIEGTALCERRWIDRVAEGAMLLAGPVDPTGIPG